VDELQDRSTGLVLFGSLQLLLGGCCALLTPLALVQVFVMRSLPPDQVPQGNVGPALFGGAFYGALAAFFISTGIGSIRARRWARTLLLVTSWMALVLGVLSCVNVAFLYPTMSQQFAALGANNPQAGAVAKGVLLFAGLVTMFVYLALPGAFVLFYRSPHVKATCERRDPTVPWTDRCPAPVLAASLMAGLGALSFLGLAITYRALPFFGTVTGWRAGVIGVTLAAVYAFAGWDLYHQRLRGWWLLLGVGVLLMVSGFVSFFRFDAMAVYQAMGYTREWAERMAPTLAAMRWSLVAFGPLWIAFLLWVRRYLG
jgi:hypothetical protein